jgi:hypothetical protein
MNFWPFRRRPAKPQGWTINLHSSVRSNATVAAAWTTYAGTKVLMRTGQYFTMYPQLQGRNTPFDEEYFARDAMAEFWAAQPPEKQRIDPYLLLLARIRAAGFLREYVWTFLREPAWPQPAGLEIQRFETWATQNRLADHKPPMLAFPSAR